MRLFIPICFLGLSISFIQSLIAQTATYNYIPLEFENLDPVWAHVSSDSTIMGHMIPDSDVGFDGYGHIRSSNDPYTERLLHDGHVYLVSRTLYDNDYAGGIVEKIDLSTGELIWKTIFEFW